MEPVDRATIWPYDESGEARDFYYSRYASPTVVDAEKGLGELVGVEAPSNPYLTMPDLAAAVAHPAPLVVDSTVATPIHLRPLEHGANFVLHSVTKYLAGHDDALLGAVAGRQLDDL